MLTVGCLDCERAIVGSQGLTNSAMTAKLALSFQLALGVRDALLLEQALRAARRTAGS